MRIDSFLVEETFCYVPDCFMQDIESLEEIQNHCKIFHENVLYEESLFESEFIDGQSFSDWLYSDYDDEHAYVLALCKEWKCAKREEAKNEILIGFHNIDGFAYGVKEYVRVRQNILSKANNSSAFIELLESCFLNLYFSEDVNQAVKRITHFKDFVPSIVQDLSILDEYALSAYTQNKNNMKEAFRIISAFVKSCSNDNHHKDDLMFMFVNDKGDRVHICCQAHTKVEYRHSNVRVYYKWNDETIKDGQKVLIGWIGPHPY